MHIYNIKCIRKLFVGHDVKKRRWIEYKYIFICSLFMIIIIFIHKTLSDQIKW